MLSERSIIEVLSAALATGGDFAEIFAEDTSATFISMINGKVEEGVSGRDYGVGIRIFQGTRSVYAYTNDLSLENLKRVAKEAAAALPGSSPVETLVLERCTVPNAHVVRIKPDQVPQLRKVEVMREAHAGALSCGPLISQVTVNYVDRDQKVLVATSEGLLTEDRRVRTRLAVQAVATKGGEKQSGFYGPGRHMGFEMFELIDPRRAGERAGRIAVTMINADYAPSGRYPVVIHNEFGGVIFHEACGHGLEATSVAKGTSVFAGKIGQQVASELVTAIDDGSIPNAWGSQNIDDEGTPTRRNVLIENGILKGYMVDKLNGRRMGMEPTGNARRQSYRFSPTSRMTNTFIDAGRSTVDDIIRSTEKGLFAKSMGGGSVNPATGEFNFAVMEGYLIENGEITKPVRGATLIGRGSEILKKIDMVADNLARGQGMCGSISGSIPADVGQPTIRVSEITVGGRKGDN
ncbi:MAG: TldD/PmbA family protein [Firmicutes bacterium]|nr:TldD/PmbA family protein [Bacillota bacterium]